MSRLEKSKIDLPIGSVKNQSVDFRDHQIGCRQGGSSGCAFLDRMMTETRLVTCDIETTYVTLLLTCIGFSINSSSAFVIPWMDHGQPHWSIEEEMTLLRKLSKVLNKLIKI